eukprot:3510163-Rhodomonas_salina.3
MSVPHIACDHPLCQYRGPPAPYPCRAPTIRYVSTAPQHRDSRGPRPASRPYAVLVPHHTLCAYRGSRGPGQAEQPGPPPPARRGAWPCARSSCTPCPRRPRIACRLGPESR